MIHMERIAHVVLKVRSLEASKAFHTEVPGMDVMNESPEIGIIFPANKRHDHRELAVGEKPDPEWFMLISDQGFMPLYEVKEQLELFGTRIMPELMG